MSMDDLLQELQLEYIQSLPEKIEELKNFFNNNDYDNILNCFHKLKGSGKTYGIEEVSIIGQFFESWLRENKESALPFAKKAIAIFEKIHQSRKNSQPYPLETDQDFQTLKNLRT